MITRVKWSHAWNVYACELPFEKLRAWFEKISRAWWCKVLWVRNIGNFFTSRAWNDHAHKMITHVKYSRMWIVFRKITRVIKKSRTWFKGFMQCVKCSRMWLSFEKVIKNKIKSCLWFVLHVWNVNARLMNYVYVYVWLATCRTRVKCLRALLFTSIWMSVYHLHMHHLSDVYQKPP